MPSIWYIRYLRTKGPVIEQGKNKEKTKNKINKIQALNSLFRTRNNGFFPMLLHQGIQQKHKSTPMNKSSMHAYSRTVIIIINIIMIVIMIIIIIVIVIIVTFTIMFTIIITIFTLSLLPLSLSLMPWIQFKKLKHGKTLQYKLGYMIFNISFKQMELITILFTNLKMTVKPSGRTIWSSLIKLFWSKLGDWNI